MAIQKTDSQDIILVKNVDIDCSEVTSEIVKTSRRYQDPDTGQMSSMYEDIPEEWNHKDFFQVKWSGHPHRIEPGKTRRMPRYIAEHYAKHLADHMLGKMEKKLDKKGLITSMTERPKMLRQILVEVEEYFLQPVEETEGARGIAEVEALNRGERPVNVGAVPPPAVGVLTADMPSLEDIVKKAGEESKDKMAASPTIEDKSDVPEGTVVDTPVGEKAETVKKEPKMQGKGKEMAKKGQNSESDEKTSIFDKTKPLPPRRELIKTAYEMGIEITGKESSDQIATLIRKF